MAMAIAAGGGTTGGSATPRCRSQGEKTFNKQTCKPISQNKITSVFVGYFFFIFLTSLL
jgi:hypothetical protein